MDTYQQFIENMEEVGYDVDLDYHGRFFYEGPAVRTNEDSEPTLQDVIRATRVDLQWDSLGRNDYIVYPK